MINQLYDQLFRQVNREVWVVTAQHGERRGGLLATWVSQASIDPIRPYVLIGIAPNHFTGELIQESGSFVVHLPGVEQARQVLPFAIGSGRTRDKLAGWTVRPGVTGAPCIEGLGPWLECRNRAVLDGGDRLYVWGEAVAGGGVAEGHQGLCERDLFAAASVEELKLLKENREHDSLLHGPLFAEWLRRVAGGQSQVIDPESFG